MAFLYLTVQNGIQTFYDFSATKRLVVSILDFYFVYFFFKVHDIG